jgi:hypothetical protein
MKYVQHLLFVVLGVIGTLGFQSFQDTPQKPFYRFALAEGSSPIPNQPSVSAKLVKTPVTKPGEWLVVVSK